MTTSTSASAQSTFISSTTTTTKDNSMSTLNASFVNANADLLGTLEYGMSPKEAYALSNDDAATRVFGIKAGTGIKGFAVGMTAKLYLRQTAAYYAEVPAGTYCFHPAFDLIALHNDICDPMGVEDLYMSDKRVTSKLLRYLQKLGAFHYGVNKKIVQAYLMIEEGTGVLVPEGWKIGLRCLGVKTGNPLVGFLPNSYGRILDMNVTLADAAVVAKDYAKAISASSVKFEKTGVSQFVLSINTTDTFTIDETGVYDNRNRRFQSVAFDAAATIGSTQTHKAEDFWRVNSYGSFIYALLFLGAHTLKSPAKLYKVMTEGTFVPMSNLEEVAASDADRVMYNKYITSTRQPAMRLPFKVINTPVRKIAQMHDKAIKHSTHKIGGKYTGASMLSKYNLVEMPRGGFIDGRDVLVDFARLPGSQVEPVLQAFFDRLNTSAVDFINSTFSTDFATDAEAIKWYASKGALVLSSKTSKAVKRCAMSRAQVGSMKHDESRYFVTVAQLASGLSVSTENVLVPSLLSFGHVLAAGTALYMVDEDEAIREQELDLLTMEVDHTEMIEPSPSLAGTTTVDNLVTLEYAPESITTQGKWIVANYNDLRLDDGEMIAMVPFQSANGIANHPVISTQPNAFLKAIKWCVGFENGNDKAVKVKIVTTTYERELKVRNNIKAMLALSTKNTLHNELNEKLVAQAIFPRDTLKCTDLLTGLTDVAAATFIKNGNEEGIELIRKANAMAGYDTVEMLVWSPIVELEGGYDALIELFESTYGRSTWLKSKDSDNAELTSVLSEMYKDWTPVKDQNHIFPEGATNCRCFSQAGADYGDKDNLLAFYEINGGTYILQRAWSFVGTPETGAVYLALKGEMSPVSSVTGQTRTMAGVIRAITADNKECGRKLTEAGYAHMHLQGAFMDMVDGNIIHKTSALNLEQVVEVLSEDVKVKSQDPSYYSELLGAFAKELKEYTLELDGFTLYIPAIHAKDANRGFKSRQGLSDLVQMLLTALVAGVSANELLTLQKRIVGALSATCHGDALGKSGAYGANACQAKAVAPNLGIPVGEIWVKESANATSTFQVLRGLYGNNFDGITVAMSRAPMVRPHYAKICVIRQDHWAFNYLGTAVLSLSPLAMTLNGGDFDGDNVAVVKVWGIPVTTLDDQIGSLVNRTGSNQLTPGGSYWGDHLEILTPAQQDKKNNKGAGTLKHLAISVDSETAKWRRSHSFPYLLENSSVCLQEYVGTIHKAFLTCEIKKMLRQQLNLTDVEGSWADKPGFDEVMAEVYENPLGGLDWAAYDALSVLVQILNGNEFVELEGLDSLLSKAGFNADFTSNIIDGCQYTEFISTMGKPENGSTNSYVVLNESDAMQAVVSLSVLISKNEVDAEIHGNTIVSLMEWAKENYTTDWKPMVEASPIVATIHNWLRTVYGTLTGVRVVDVEMFS